MPSFNTPIAEIMPFKIHPVSDVPTDEAKLLEHSAVIFNLQSFLESESMITPISIAIHGEWGSGKTSIMKTLEKRLGSSKFEILFFDAWKYEYSNPSLGLLAEIAAKYTAGDTMTKIIRLGSYLLTQKSLGVDPDQVLRYIQNSQARSNALSDTLKTIVKKKIGSKKLIIIIDDLDRCDVENSLQLLALLKLFLDIDNCICMAAVDFERLKQAWMQKYQTNDKQALGGSNYLDKIFQIRIGIPKPSSKQIKEYIKTLVDYMPDDIVEMFSLILPKNPRSIKKTLNLISYRINMLSGDHKEFAAIFWTLLEEVISNESVIDMHERLSNNGSSLGHLIVSIDSWKPISDLFGNIMGSIITMHSSTLDPFFTLGHKIACKDEMDKDVLDQYFRILYGATNEALSYTAEYNSVNNRQI